MQGLTQSSLTVQDEAGQRGCPAGTAPWVVCYSRVTMSLQMPGHLRWPLLPGHARPGLSGHIELTPTQLWVPWDPIYIYGFFFP